MSKRSYERALILTTMTRTRSAGLRDSLVAAADELMDDAAPGSLTTRQIARHAAVSDGVLYNHFADRDALVRAALVRRYSRLVQTFEGRLAEEGEEGEGADTSLDAGLRAFTRALRDLEVDALHLAAGLLSEPSLLHAFWVDIHGAPLGLHRLERPLVDKLVAARESGLVPQTTDIRAATTALFGIATINALAVRLNPTADRQRLDQDLDAAVALVAAGLAQTQV
jgi:AcrR family transcriptional regulator